MHIPETGDCEQIDEYTFASLTRTSMSSVYCHALSSQGFPTQFLSHGKSTRDMSQRIEKQDHTHHFCCRHGPVDALHVCHTQHFVTTQRMNVGSIRLVRHTIGAD